MNSPALLVVAPSSYAIGVCRRDPVNPQLFSNKIETACSSSGVRTMSPHNSFNLGYSSRCGVFDDLVDIACCTFGHLNQAEKFERLSLIVTLSRPTSGALICCALRVSSELPCLSIFPSPHSWSRPKTAFSNRSHIGSSSSESPLEPPISVCNKAFDFGLCET